MSETATRPQREPPVIYDDGLPVPRRYWSVAAMAMAVMLAGTARLVGQSLGAVGVALCFHIFTAAPTVSCLAAGALSSAVAAAVSFSRRSEPHPKLAV